MWRSWTPQPLRSRSLHPCLLLPARRIPDCGSRIRAEFQIESLDHPPGRSTQSNHVPISSIGLVGGPTSAVATLACESSSWTSFARSRHLDWFLNKLAGYAVG